MRELTLRSSVASVRIVTEPNHSFNSADNVQAYPDELSLSDDGYVSTIFGLWIDDSPSLVVGAGGGTSGVHESCALILHDRLFMAIGDQIACFSLQPLALEWSIQGDHASCFGIYFSSSHNALICHGELAISRLSEDGEIIWSEGGRDIFTGEFRLAAEFVEVRDFYDELYRFAYDIAP